MEADSFTDAFNSPPFLNPLPPFVLRNSTCLANSLRNFSFADFPEDVHILEVIVVEQRHGVWVRAKKWPAEIASESLIPDESLKKAESHRIRNLKTVRPKWDSGNGVLIRIPVLGNDVRHVQRKAATRNTNSMNMFANVAEFLHEFVVVELLAPLEFCCHVRRAGHTQLNRFIRHAMQLGITHRVHDMTCHLRGLTLSRLVVHNSNSAGETWRAVAIRIIDVSVGLRSPRSTPPTYVLWMPAAVAKSSWESPRFFRSSLTDSPNAMHSLDCFSVMSMMIVR